MKMRFAFLFLVTLPLIGACGNSTITPPKEAATPLKKIISDDPIPETLHPPQDSYRNKSLSKMEAEIDKIQKEIPATSCDAPLLGYKKEIAKKIATHEKLIQSHLGQPGDPSEHESGMEYIDFGSGKIGLDSTDQNEKRSRGKFKSSGISWSQLHGYLKKNIDEYQDDPRFWTFIYDRFVYLMHEDQRRVIYKIPYFLGNEDTEIITRENRPALVQCANQEKCTLEDLPETIRTKLSKDPLFIASSEEDQKKHIFMLLYRLMHNPEEHAVTKPNSSGSPLEITVQLTSKTLKKRDYDVAQNWIDAYWNTQPNRLKIKIEPKKESSNNIFEIIQDALRGRSFVHAAKKFMKLYNFQTQKVFLHEFGHILGLKDEYFPSFDYKTCRYSTESDFDNLMSEHKTGHVLDRHIEELLFLYQAQ